MLAMNMLVAIFLNVRDEDRICHSKYGWGKWALVTDNSEIMKIDLD